MAETDVDIARSASGSYNFSAYEDEDWPRISIRRPEHSGRYPAGLLGPECLLAGSDTGSSYQHLHTQGAYDAWRASNGR